ncbi:MAG: hypothetical protein BWY02_01939 [bacterium ADurb.Bin157]|nr:MAG: hypothetical protein BWY02_01939 [bacterium ADurb.Bin157]
MKHLKTVLISMPFVICLVLIAGCGGHDTSTLPKSLIGHWVTKTGDKSGETHYYFDSSTSVMMDEGTRTDLSYTVLESNESENWMKIRVKSPYGMGHDKHLAFSPERKSLNATIESEIFGETISISFEWEYVDAKTTP